MTAHGPSPGARSASEILEALERLPRRVLGAYPTPLVPLERLGGELGRRLYLKRDDILGPAGGGNKTRKLEYLLADALEGGATRVVTVGGPQSNHARVTAGGARVLGLEPHLWPVAFLAIGHSTMKVASRPSRPRSELVREFK